MRITNSMMSSQQISVLQASMAALQKASDQATSGKRINQASDDPAAALSIMQSGSSMRALDQYRTNIQRATSRVNVEDGVLQQINDLLARAKELGVSQASDTATAQTRAAASAELGQIFKQIVDLGNTKFGDEYLFGGNQAATPPFGTTGNGVTLDFTSTNPVGQRTVGVADGELIAPTHDGQQIFVDTGVLSAVRDVARAIDPSLVALPGQLTTALTSLDSAIGSIQGVVGDTGAVANRLTAADANVTALKTNLITFKSNLEDVDIETAMTELTTRQLAYQAALLATSKVGSTSLVDYLR